VIEKLQQMNRHNVTFILNGSPNQKGKLDQNFIKRYAEIGKLYHKPEDLSTLPQGWMKR
jgi:alpha-L-fucosidase